MAALDEAIKRQVVAASRMAKASAEEMWKSHVENGHTPLRRDCRACIQGGLRGRSHRKRSHPALTTLAIDVTGPFETCKEGHHYLLVGSYVTAVAENMAKEDEVEKEAGEDPSEDPFDEEGALRIEGEDKGEVRRGG